MFIAAKRAARTVIFAVSNYPRIIAVTLALALPTQPLLAWPALWRMEPASSWAQGNTIAPTSTEVCYPAPADDARIAIADASAFMPAMMLVPLSSLEPAALDSQRGVIASQLIELGYAADIAQHMADELTPHDLEVLLANPKMVQKAGEMDELTKNVIWALVIAGVVVALVIASDGSISL